MSTLGWEPHGSLQLASVLVTKGPHSTELPQTVLHPQSCPAGFQPWAPREAHHTSKPIATPEHTLGPGNTVTPQDEHSKLGQVTW